MQHPGVNCDACNRSIEGYRYKCIECDDFDLCQLCESDYHSGHVLCRFANPVTQLDKEFLKNINYRRPRDKPFLIQGYHDGVQCNVCGSEYVVGFLYKCVDCPNFDVCRRCEKRNSNCGGGKTHLLVRFADPLELNSFNKRFWQEILEIRSTMRCLNGEQEVTSVMPSILTSGLAIHKGTKCDDCNNNIVGLRFKCLDCPDFDLCSNCEPKNLHPGHLLVRIGTPIASKTQALFVQFLKLQSLKQSHEVQEKPPISSAWTMNNCVVSCDNCQTPTHGFRYKCFDCRDFDLCSFCQKKQCHTEHLMIRFTEPLSQNAANQAFLEAIKKSKRSMGSMQDVSRPMCTRSVTGSREDYSNNKTLKPNAPNVNQNSQGVIQKCTVCYAMPSDIILLECGHLCICSNCIAGYLRASQQCPICRRPIKSSHRAYY